MATHVIIPDTQCAPGSDLTFLTWIGKYIVKQFWGQPDVKVIHLGDHWDMPSLSTYDDGKRQMEGRRVLADIQAGVEGFDLLNAPLFAKNARKKALKEKQWYPEMHYIRGNHDHRVVRMLELEPKMDGVIDYDSIKPGWPWVTHEFLDLVWIDDIAYSHYFVNPSTGIPLSGMMDTRLKNLGHSFIQGHIPGRQFAVRRLASPQGPRELMGMVLGSCYLPGPHIDYQGSQGSNYWNGIVVLFEAAKGTGDPLFLSLDFLKRKFG